MLTKVVCICLLSHQKSVTCSILVQFVLFYECLQSKTCSLSFQNLVTFFIHWFIWFIDLYFGQWQSISKMGMGQKWIWTSDVIYQSDPIFKLSSKILFVWSCDLSLMLYIVIIRKLAVIWSSLTHLSWNWDVYEREKSKDIIYLYLALFGCHQQL